MARSQDEAGMPVDNGDGRPGGWRRLGRTGPLDIPGSAARGFRGLVARLDGSPRLLRWTWMLWLASFTVLYAYLTLFVEAVDLPDYDPGSWPWRFPFPYREGPWTWDVELWLPMVLAVVVPAAVHRVLARRISSPFFAERASEGVKHDYRSPRPWVIGTSPALVRQRVRLYSARLGIAMGLSMVPFHVLLSTRFQENFGCVGYAYVRSPAEHLAFATMLFAVAAFHAPFTRRVLGERPEGAVRGG